MLHIAEPTRNKHSTLLAAGLAAGVMMSGTAFSADPVTVVSWGGS